MDESADSTPREDFSSLEDYLTQITAAATQTDKSFVSLKTQLSVNTFSLHGQRITPASQSTIDLLNLLEVQKGGLTIGSFLKSLTHYVVTKNLVDSADHEIYLTEELRAGFQFEPGTIKVPYAACIGRIASIFQ